MEMKYLQQELNMVLLFERKSEKNILMPKLKIH